MQFTTQKEILEYLGKNPEDRKLIQRMRERGEVYKEDGMYILVENKQTLIEENRQLKLKVHELENLKPMSDDERREMTKLIKENFRLEKELKEEKINSEYYQRMYEEDVADKQNRIRKCFRRIQQIKPRADWEEFRDWVLSDEEL